MSFILSPRRNSVAFDVTTQARIRFDVTKTTCILDINSNTWINLREFALDEIVNQGNYSNWVPLRANEGVAVSGLTSCGAVFVANNDFSKVAAGHMSGDARFVDG